MSPGHGVGPGPRREVGAAEHAREKPHVTVNDQDAPVQDGTQAPNDVAALGANAHGIDTQRPHDQPQDDESMYDGRPEEGIGD